MKLQNLLGYEPPNFVAHPVMISGDVNGVRCGVAINLKRKMGVFVELALSEVFDFGFVWW
jgi:hypothetical protein